MIRNSPPELLPEVEIRRKCACTRKNRRYLRNWSSYQLHVSF